MSVTLNSVVQIHYTLKDDAGDVLDSSDGGEPLTYLHGHGNLIPGLERELEGKKTGDRLNVAIKPADGYGEYDEGLVQRVPREAVEGAGNEDIEEGMRVHAQTEHGVHTLVVTEVDA